MKAQRVLSALIAPLALLASPAAAQQILEEEIIRDDSDPLVEVERTDVEMEAAIAEAKATLPEWLGILEQPPAGANMIVFKFPLNGWEHIWVNNVERRGDTLVGTLANDPLQNDWSEGDRVEVPLSDVSDWAWWDGNGRAHGYRTFAVLLPRLPESEASELRERLGWSQ